MARNVFFSFHYDNDVTRAWVVRNSWVTQPNRSSSGVIDKAEFEKIKKDGDAAVKRWIDSQLIGTTVTVVLIGAETLMRPFIKYEIEQSLLRGNAIIGIFVNNIKDFDQQTSTRCDTSNFQYKLYDWVSADGYNNLGNGSKMLQNSLENKGGIINGKQN
ncbi:MAG: TIR domain-containing protein [Ferruginibacter sp.]